MILDEPASGLDPRARYEMKEILKDLKQFGKTVVISSHILHELAEICTTVGIMENGKLLVYGSIDNILIQAKEKHTLKIQVYAGKEKVLRLLKENPNVERVSILQDCLKLSFKGTEEEEAKLLRSLIEGGAEINSFLRERGDLEELFMTLTEEGEGEHENQSNFK